jgi:hypothetical protein
MNSDDALRYPIGKNVVKESYTPAEVLANIKRIEALPARIEGLTNSFSAQQLDTPYRAGGWTARQVIHHIADSHVNAYIRVKWTLTEETPTIKAYEEKNWAVTGETSADPNLSVALLKALHQKWVVLLYSLTPDVYDRRFLHPETQKHVRIDQMIATYAWHGEHHEGHLRIVAGNA